MPTRSPNLRLRPAEPLAQFGESRRLLHAVQVLALQVLDDRHLRRLLVGTAAQLPEWFPCPAIFDAPAAPFAKHQQVAPSFSGRTTSGDHAARLDGVAQLDQKLLIKLNPRLVGLGSIWSSGICRTDSPAAGRAACA